MRSHRPIVLERAKAFRDSPRQDDLTPNFYRILGLRRDADSKEIKAAYRTLTKRFHPDINVSDMGAEQRTKEINRAYQTLGDPEARAAYDGELARQRAEARGRFWKGVATGVATFVLTASSASLVALLLPHSNILRWEIGERVVPAENKSVAAKLPEHSSAHSGASERADLGSSDVPNKRAAGSLPGPFGKSPIPPEQTSQEPLQQQPSSHGEIGHVGSPDGKARTSDEPAAQPGPLLEPTPKEEVVSAPSSVLPTKEMPPASAEDKLPSTEVANLALPKIVDEQQPPPAVSMAPAVPRGKPAIWTQYQNARSGFALRYPADVFTSAGDDVENKDRLLMSKDGRALLRISSMPNRATMTVTEYRQSLMAERYAGATFDYTPQGNHWFVLSGTVGEEMFYERITFSCDRRSIHGWLLVYPLAERSFFDAIIEEIHRSYRYDLDASGRCGELKSEGARVRQRPEKSEAQIDMMQF